MCRDRTSSRNSHWVRSSFCKFVFFGATPMFNSPSPMTGRQSGLTSDFSQVLRAFFVRSRSVAAAAAAGLGGAADVAGVFVHPTLLGSPPARQRQSIPHAISPSMVWTNCRKLNIKSASPCEEERDRDGVGWDKQEGGEEKASGDG